MQHNLFNGWRSLKLIDGCKNTQVYAVHQSNRNGGGAPSKNINNFHEHHRLNSLCSVPSISIQSFQTTSLSETLLPDGLPTTFLLEPEIQHDLQFVDFVETLANVYRQVENSHQSRKSEAYFKQCAIFRGLSDPRLFRRSLRLTRQHAIDIHTKIVLSAWLRFERREDELIGSSSMDCCGQNIECPKASLVSGYDPESVYDPCLCRAPREDQAMTGDDDCSTSEEDGDMSFCIGNDEVRCIRYKIAGLSRPFRAMLYGDFIESRRELINFSHNGVSVRGLRAAEVFSRTKRVELFDPGTVLELLSFANRFCCEEMKLACDAYLASLVHDMDTAAVLVDYGLEETAYLLVASCLQVFLRELPRSMHNPQITRLFCSYEGKQRLDMVGHATFALYFFLSQTALEDDLISNITVMLLERLEECASERWQKQVAFHQLGCVMLKRREFKDAQHYFEAAAQAGHIYSLVGIARAKFKRGHKYAAYKLMNSLISEYTPVGWMFQERSLYCDGEEKIGDLKKATELDPTLSFPYKYRAVLMVEENKIGAAISEINKIIGFNVSPGCLELRAWFLISLEDYEGALSDIRALLTLDPSYMMFNGKMHADQLLDLLCLNVPQWSQAECWIQLYDRWSSVDDIGSLAVVHQMLANEPSCLFRFRQSLLLSRLNCQKAAMHSLRLARNYSKSEHERLVYEGWMLYDTGHREEALSKAEESISIQRSFEAFFLKAYLLLDSSDDCESSSKKRRSDDCETSSFIIQLLEEALNCPSDGLRKGQALNSLGRVFEDCDKLDDAADCYTNALNIKHTRAHQGLARVYHLKNQSNVAYDEMTKLIEKARNNASAYEKRAGYCDREMAMSDLIMATRLDPLRTYPYRYRAAAFMDDQKEAEGIQELTKVIGFRHDDMQVLSLRAACHESMGDLHSTLRDCEAALCLHPTHSETQELYHKAQHRLKT